MNTNQKPWRIYLCGGMNCGPLSRAKLERALDDALWSLQIDTEVDVRISSCQNRCEFAPNMTIWPGPFRYCLLTPERIYRILAEHVCSASPITEWLIP